MTRILVTDLPDLISSDLAFLLFIRYVKWHKTCNLTTQKSKNRSCFTFWVANKIETFFSTAVLHSTKQKTPKDEQQTLLFAILSCSFCFFFNSLSNTNKKNELLMSKAFTFKSNNKSK